MVLVRRTDLNVLAFVVGDTRVRCTQIYADGAFVHFISSHDCGWGMLCRKLASV